MPFSREQNGEKGKDVMYKMYLRWRRYFCVKLAKTPDALYNIQDDLDSEVGC